MMSTHSRSWCVALEVSIALASMVVFTGCPGPSQNGSGDQPSGQGTTQPNPVVTVDATLRPVVTSLTPLDDGVPRPIATLTDKSGIQADFVENEVMISTNDPAALNAFVAKYQGTIVGTADPTQAALNVPLTFLVRIDTTTADRSQLNAALAALNPNTGTEVRVSSEAGANLIAAAAVEAAAGSTMGINFITRPTGFQDRSLTEGNNPIGTLQSANGSYSEPCDPNPFNWSYMKVRTVQGFGVAEAWRVLDRIGAFNNKVKIAVIDGGFGNGDDFPSDWTFEGATLAALDPAGQNDLSCSNNSPCPWHGENVVQTVAGQVNNGFGAAGSAGPVARIEAIRHSGDIFNNIQLIPTAVFSGAKIINMSFDARVPASLSWTVEPFNALTAAVRAGGTLIFASAGNDNENIDDEDCFIVCWESAWFTPCENDGVICVGALDANSGAKRPDSNYGSDDLDIWGPGSVWVGYDLATQGPHMFNATSAASPFVAGIAALIWAANPGLGAGDVENILYNTAIQGGTGEQSRWPNAYAAVIQALGDTPPEIANVKAGRTGFTGRDVVFSCDATDVEDGTPQVVWTSDVVPNLGTGTFLGRDDLPDGVYHVTATAIDSKGLKAIGTTSFSLQSSRPTVLIDAPKNGSSFYSGQTVFFQAFTFDLDSGKSLPDDKVVWTSNVEGTLGTGNFLQHVLNGTGSEIITATGTNPNGLSSSDNTSVTLSPPPPDGLPPTAFIYTFDYNPNQPNPEITLAGVGNDKEDGPLTGNSLAWTISGDCTWNIPEGVAHGNFVNAILQPQKTPASFVITLTATDSTGKTGSYSVNGMVNPLN